MGKNDSRGENTQKHTSGSEKGKKQIFVNMTYSLTVI